LVIAPEATEWGRLWTNQSASGASDPLDGRYDYGHALAKDLDAWVQVDIVGTQLYDTQVAAPWPSDVPRWPSDVPQPKTVWMTEVCGLTGWPEGGPSSDINNGIAVAGWIHDAIANGGASAWLWFWYKAGSTDDNEGLLLKSGTDTKRHYTLGNYSKFIRPGYTRVDIGGSMPADVLLSAYKAGGTDSTVVIVAINKGSATATVPISIPGGTAPVSLTPWVTSASDNLQSGTAVTVSGGSFTATLASMTVTTFIGK
jgi:O-glycosyl hydrolase